MAWRDLTGSLFLFSGAEQKRQVRKFGWVTQSGKNRQSWAVLVERTFVAVNDCTERGACRTRDFALSNFVPPTTSFTILSYSGRVIIIWAFIL